MKNVKDILIIVLLLLLVGVVVWALFFNKPKPVIEYRYKTITDTLEIPYSVPKPYPVHTPPKILHYYSVDSSMIDSLKIIISDQDIIIKGLKDSVLLHEGYLKQYPINPKLLSVDFNRDTFKMGLLEISGYLGDWQFPIDVNRYSYRWNVSDGFTRKEVKPTLAPPALKEPFANYFVGGAVDIWHVMPQITARAEKQFSNTRIYISTQVGLLKLDRSSFNVGLEYQLNGKINR